MALHAAPPRPAFGAWWAALVVVPLAFAALGLVVIPPLPTPPPPSPVPVPATPAPAPPFALAGSGPITFAADRAELVGPSATAVAHAAQLLGAVAGPRVTVTGYAADTPGPAAVAQRLSERRAQVVVDALVAAGVRRERLVAVGRGATEPLATPALSRRVEISAD